MNRNVYTATQILACNCEKLFDVIADVASYPQYLHGWEQVRVTKRDDGIALEWQLSSNGSGHCQVRLQIESRAHNPMLRQIINHYIQRTSKQMFSRFSQRVEKLYGESCKLL